MRFLQPVDHPGKRIRLAGKLADLADDEALPALPGRGRRGRLPGRRSRRLADGRRRRSGDTGRAGRQAGIRVNASCNAQKPA